MYSDFFIAMYNIFYTSQPVIMMAVLDQDVNAAHALTYAKLYAPGMRNMFFNRAKFAVSAWEGIMTSFVLVMTGLGTIAAHHQAVVFHRHNHRCRMLCYFTPPAQITHSYSFDRRHKAARLREYAKYGRLTCWRLGRSIPSPSTSSHRLPIVHSPDMIAAP